MTMKVTGFLVRWRLDDTEGLRRNVPAWTTWLTKRGQKVWLVNDLVD